MTPHYMPLKTRFLSVWPRITSLHPCGFHRCSERNIQLPNLLRLVTCSSSSGGGGSGSGSSSVHLILWSLRPNSTTRDMFSTLYTYCTTYIATMTPFMCN